MKLIKTVLTTSLLTSVALTTPFVAQAKEGVVKLESSVDKASYGSGYQFAKSFENSPLKPNIDALILGVRDAATGKPARLSNDELSAAFKELSEEMQKQAKIEAEKNAKLGSEFLEKNKKESGVKTTASGLQYKVVKAAPKDAKKPKASDNVTVHYRGTLIDGKEFDSSYTRGEPASFGVGQVIKGWTEALQLMGKGAKWKLYIPSELAYGKDARPNIPPNSVLVFDVELLDIK